jgi:membrane fusion protein (multidrug efflux system)
MTINQSQLESFKSKLQSKNGIISIIILVLIILSYGYWASLSTVSTDNAYIQANTFTISSEIKGRIKKLYVQSNDIIKAGDAIMDIDGEEYELMVIQASNALHSIVNTINAKRALLISVGDEISKLNQRIELINADLESRNKLHKKNYISQFDLDNYKQQLYTLQTQLIETMGKQNELLAFFDQNPDLKTEDHPTHKEAMAQLSLATLNLQRTHITAPVDGQIHRLSLTPGNFVNVGSALFYMVDTNTMWVEANFKETDLNNVRPNQKVELTFDMYPNLKINGKVQGIAPASGQVFALLPPQNATGNWVKIVQRVPVRIDFEIPKDAPPLKAGTSTNVTITID